MLKCAGVRSGGKTPPLPAPDKYPREQQEGPAMDYSECAFPKPKKKAKKKKGWGK